MPLAIRALCAFLVLFTCPVAGVTQDEPETPRDVRMAIEVLDRGDGTPVILRWRRDDVDSITLQVTTRTVPENVDSPGLGESTPPSRPAEFSRPPMEKAWTIQGRLARADAPDASEPRLEARWRVMDAAARLIGTRPVPSVAEDTEASNAQEPGGDDEPTPLDDAPDPARAASLARAINFERITNESLGRTDGAAITQVLGPEGFRPGTTTARLAAADRRGDFEISGLVSIMTLAEPALPDEPIAVGGSWRTRWYSVVRATPLVTEATWTLTRVDEAAAATGVAESAVLRVEFTRRVADGADVGEAQRLASETKGRGEVRILLGSPTRLDGRFVESPIRTFPGRITEVTRMSLTPIATR